MPNWMLITLRQEANYEKIANYKRIARKLMQRMLGENQDVYKRASRILLK